MIATLAGASLAPVTSFALCFLGCSSDDARSDPGSVVSPDAGAAEVGAVADATVVPPGYDGGVGLGLADLPDTPCAARGGSVAVVLAGDVDASTPVPTFRALHGVGERRVADAADGSSFVVFDADGKNAKVVLRAPLAGGGSLALGSQIVSAWRREEDRVLVQSYDPSGAPAGALVQIANEYPELIGGVAAGADATHALVVWTTSTGLRARGFTAGAGTGESPYNLAITSKVALPSMAVSSVQSGLFAVVFSGGDDSVGYQTAFGRGSPTGRIGDPTNLFSSALPRTVVGLARTPSGFALLVTVADGANPYAMLVFTDLGGRRLGPGLKLLGTSEATAIAVNGAEIGVLAQRREGDAFESKRATEFRAFDSAGAPLGPWVCLEAPGNGGSRGGGLVAENKGYAALFAATDGSASLARFDHLGK